MNLQPKKTLRALIFVAVGLAAGLLTAIQVRQHRTFDAPYPDIHASRDPRVIERGRYLAYGLGHCVDCHGDPARAGSPPEEIALSGGREFVLPFGTVRARNITPDRETGIGRYSDPELARILRYGVHADGRAVLPFMPFAGLADDDLAALISFLRAQPPVRNAVPPHDLNLAGKAVLAFALQPQGPEQTPPRSVPPAPTAEYGRYLATSVAGCVKCHTRLDRTGQLAAPPFSGGVEHGSAEAPGRTFIAPNLTPDPDSGRITAWPEDLFVARMKAGPIDPHSPMPWRAFSRMSDVDARALFRYLRSLPPASAPTAPSEPPSQRAVASAR